MSDSSPLAYLRERICELDIGAFLHCKEVEDSLRALDLGPRAVVPNRGGIPPQGGIALIQGRNIHLIAKLPNQCKCFTSFLC